MMVSPYYIWAIYMSIIDSLSLAQMKNRKLGSQFWGDDRERLNKGRRGKGIYRMAGLTGNCCKVLMSREIWGNLSKAFWARLRAVAGDHHKERWWRRVDKSQQAWPKCNTEQARRKQCVLFRSSVRLSISTSFLAGWDRAPNSTGYSEVTREK